MITPYIYVPSGAFAEVFHFTTEQRAKNFDWPEWLNRAWCKPHNEVGSVYPADFPDSDGTDELFLVVEQRGADGKGCITPQRVCFGDYFVFEADGTLSAVNAEILADKFRRV